MSEQPNLQIDIIHLDNDGWWFWDKYFVDRHGPYTSMEEATKELRQYYFDFYGKQKGVK